MSAPRLPSGSIPLRERRSLADEWEDFARKILPATAGSVQRRETRRAFYGGAAVMFGLMTNDLDPQDDATDLDVAYMESLHRELAQYTLDLHQGRA